MAQHLSWCDCRLLHVTQQACRERRQQQQQQMSSEARPQALKKPEELEVVSDNTTTRAVQSILPRSSYSLHKSVHASATAVTRT